MSLSLDHVFILTEPGAESAGRLADLGLTEGTANTHPGQGTSNRRFFLNGFTIELLYVSDRDEALNGAGRVLGLVNRIENFRASPFGVVVRVSSSDSTPDFPNWRYFPDYFDGKLSFHVGENSALLEEPLCICMPPSLPKAQAVPTEYANPEWRLTGLEITVPTMSLSTTMQHVAAIPEISFITGESHVMSMTFNNGAAGRSENLNPELPMTVSW